MASQNDSPARNLTLSLPRGAVSRERERRREARSATPPGMQPWLIEALGPERGQMLWDRLGDSDPPRTLYTLRKIFNTRGGGKAAVVRYAEVMAAHPEWVPSKSASKVSILMLHTGLRENFVATARDASPRNLMMMIDLAVDYAGRLQRQQEERERPRSVPAYENNFEELRQYYRRSQETMEQPLHDEDIFICDVRVRERGVNSANYVMEWNCTYWILLLMAHGQNMTSFSRDQIRDMGALLGRIFRPDLSGHGPPYRAVPARRGDGAQELRRPAASFRAALQARRAPHADGRLTTCRR